MNKPYFFGRLTVDPQIRLICGLFLVIENKPYLDVICLDDALSSVLAAMWPGSAQISLI